MTNTSVKILVFTTFLLLSYQGFYLFEVFDTSYIHVYKEDLKVFLELFGGNETNFLHALPTSIFYFIHFFVTYCVLLRQWFCGVVDVYHPLRIIPFFVEGFKYRMLDGMQLTD